MMQWKGARGKRTCGATRSHLLWVSPMLIIVVAVANPAPEEAAARAHTALQGRKMAFRCMVGWGLQPAVFKSTKLTWMC